MRMHKTIFDRGLIHESGGGEKVKIMRRGLPIGDFLGTPVLDYVDFIQVPPSSEDYILPTGETISAPKHDAFLSLNQEQVDFVEEYLEDNKCLPILTGDYIEKGDDNCRFIITRVDYGSGWILLDIEEEFA